MAQDRLSARMFGDLLGEGIHCLQTAYSHPEIASPPLAARDARLEAPRSPSPILPCLPGRRPPAPPEGAPRLSGRTPERAAAPHPHPFPAGWEPEELGAGRCPGGRAGRGGPGALRVERVPPRHRPLRAANGGRGAAPGLERARDWPARGPGRGAGEASAVSAVIREGKVPCAESRAGARSYGGRSGRAGPTGRAAAEEGPPSRPRLPRCLARTSATSRGAGDFRAAAMGGVGEPGGGPGPREGPAPLGAPLPALRWEQIRQHDLPGDKWLVIERRVYDISRWAQRHPGGSRLIGHHGAEDATDAFHAFHQDLQYVRKFLKPLLIGELAPEEPSQDGAQNAQLIKDFQALRQAAEDLKLFKADPVFFALLLGHILAMEVLAWLIVYLLGPGWVSSILAALILAVSQAQCWCLQHDLGHASIFTKSGWNHVAQQFVMGQLKGFSAHWWNFRHFQHHAKPNIFHKDPDVTVAPVFLLGESSVEYGRKKRRYLPYNHQHLYFFLIGPPLLTLVNFEVENLAYMLVCLQWTDLLWAASFYCRFFLSYVPFYGATGALLLFVAVRVLESHWFVWITQMNHIPKEIGHEKHRDWASSQLAATCNVEPSLFIDWFSGHLNFQIEHHLFPTMPRHNYRRVAPLVKAFCAKHGLHYEVKPFLTALVDIIGSLKKSGDLWLDAYLHQ